MILENEKLANNTYYTDYELAKDSTIENAFKNHNFVLINTLIKNADRAQVKRIFQAMEKDLLPQRYMDIARAQQLEDFLDLLIEMFPLEGAQKGFLLNQAALNNWEVIILRLAKEPNIPHKFREEAFFSAAKCGHLHLVKLLDEHKEVSSKVMQLTASRVQESGHEEVGLYIEKQLHSRTCMGCIRQLFRKIFKKEAT